MPDVPKKHHNFRDFPNFLDFRDFLNTIRTIIKCQDFTTSVSGFSQTAISPHSKESTETFSIHLHLQTVCFRWIFGVLSRKWTCSQRRDHFKRRCHLPTIDFQGVLVSVQGCTQLSVVNKSAKRPSHPSGRNETRYKSCRRQIVTKRGE